jgi:CHAD domain-containing protein
MGEARAKATDEALHEWRKRTQDLRYSLELLKPAWPETVGPLAAQAHALSDLLGDDHDLVVLREVAAELHSAHADQERDLISALITERRKALQDEAFELGAKLYEEDEDAFTERLTAYWKAARRAAGARSNVSA